MINLNKMKIISIICACFFSENIGVTGPNFLLDFGNCECDRAAGANLAGYVSCGPFCTAQVCVASNQLGTTMTAGNNYETAKKCAEKHEKYHMDNDNAFWDGCWSSGILQYNTTGPLGKHCHVYVEEANAYLAQLNCLVDCINTESGAIYAGCLDSYNKYYQYYADQLRDYFNNNCSSPPDPPLPPASELKQIIPRSY